VIKNAVLHIANEQPMLCDLFELPNPSDVALRCTNLRNMDGKRPIFIDEISSVFIFPYLHIRFVEVPAAAAVAAGTDLPVQVPVAAAVGASQAPDPADDEGEIAIDEDFLRRIREV
jgi:hypothetical protein